MDSSSEGLFVDLAAIVPERFIGSLVLLGESVSAKTMAAVAVKGISHNNRLELQEDVWWAGELFVAA